MQNGNYWMNLKREVIYSISQSDMYQLYAYGKKYALDDSSEDKEPELVLLYPSNPNFKNALEKFIYDGGLTLNVITFLI